MRRVLVSGVVSTVLVAAAVVAWVDVLAAPAKPASVAAPTYVPPIVEIDQGVNLDYTAVADEVTRLVNDPRGWHKDMTGFRLRIVEPGIGGTTRMDKTGYIGMAHHDKHLVLITEEAWTTLGRNFAAAGGTLGDQRTWIVLHELGHLLGHPHTDCPGSGPAPVMRGTDYVLGGCSYNVWPNPRG